MTGPSRPLKIALLCDFHLGSAGTIIDHIEGIKGLSENEVTVINFRGNIPKAHDIDKFDGVIIHYTLVACVDSYLSPESRIKIRRFRGIKAAFVQDDYRFINDTVNAMRAMRVHLLFVLAPPDIIDEVYSPDALPGVQRETVLAGYVPENLLDVDVPPLAERRIDVGYRARKLPAWLGTHGQEKWVIGDRFEADAAKHGLKTDISCREADRIYGAKWIEFLTNCRAVLGTESGSGICDFTGEIQERVEAHVARFPETPFEELRDLYFKEEDGRLMMNVISPRCFEAAALRTLMILYEGEYSGRMTPWRHYIPLQKNHSNMDEVVAILRDSARCQEIVDRAYSEVALNRANWFRSMVLQVDRAVSEAFRANGIELRKAVGKTAFKPKKQREKVARGESIKYVLLVNSVRALDTGLLILPDKIRHRARSSIKKSYYSILSMRAKFKYFLNIITYTSKLYFDKNSNYMVYRRYGLKYIEDVVVVYEKMKIARFIGDVRAAIYHDPVSRTITIGISDFGVSSEEIMWGERIGENQLKQDFEEPGIMSVQLAWHPSLTCLLGHSFGDNRRELKGLAAAVRRDPVPMLGNLLKFINLGQGESNRSAAHTPRLGVAPD